MARQFILACAVTALMLIGVGCVPMTPALQADNAQIASLKTDIAGLKTQIATASTQPSATQPAGIADLAAKNAQLQADNAALVKAQAQQAADKLAAQQQAIQQATAAAQAGASAVPGPWAPVAVAIIGVLGMLGQSYLKRTSDKTSSDNHAANIQTAIAAVANSVPVASLPANVQPYVKGAVAATNAIFTPAPTTPAGSTPSNP